jgi:NAD(P)-dependent dehydrogenase (short-subunit alcohol dehydrogenase family)
MTITFITGANKGLGYETARRLIQTGQTVLIGARDPERGQTAADQLDARFVPIDVAHDESVARAAEDIEAHEGRIDVLINNAAIIGSHLPAEELAGPDATEIFNTNVAGIVRVTHAFLPLLRLSEHPSVINVSSLESVVLTVGRARPVAVATSAAVSAASLESAASTFARVSPGAVRVGVADLFVLLAARVLVRARVGVVEVALRVGRFAAGLEFAGLGSEAGRSRGSSAASA